MKILHTADVQVKNREKNLYRTTEKSLKQIEQKVIETGAEIFIIAGDLFEYAEPNDSERKLIYNFLSKVVNIPTLKELVIISGNHDLIKEKKQTDILVGYNPVNTFTDMLDKFSLGDKIIYLSESKYYNSRVSDKIQYLAYSLEDGMELDLSGKDESKFTICVFHEMLKEYVDSVKLPLRKDIYSKLKSIDIFPGNSLITAGDIHKNLIFSGLDDQIFIYPGSPMEHTHSEGTYINLTGNTSEKTETKFGEPKVLKLYEFSDSEPVNIKNIKFTEVQLDKFQTYVTISIDAKQSVGNIVENLKNIEIPKGNEITFIKVKSVNTLVKHEQTFFNILAKRLNDDLKHRFKIEFEYDKFIQTENSVNNTVIQKIIDEKKDELNLDNDSSLDIELDSKNIDDLILTDKHLKNLFKSILDAQLKKVSNDDITNDDISSDVMALFEKELTELQTNSKRYNINLEEIETSTGFMALLPTKIDLSIPGLTRIFGTNGIGKTTLYRMIRWVISGEVFEGMAKNTVAKNNLIVFNKNLIDSDIVEVKLKKNINNLKIVATRRVERKWKNNTTDDQKAAINWKDHIATVDRQFVIDVETVNGDKKQFTGEQAEKSILLWFGQTINNILFINYPKLESLLQTASDKLNEMILNFIGVDYLNLLESNLDKVKTELMSVSKPKRNKEDIRNSVVDSKIFIKKAEELITETEKQILEVSNSITETNINLDEKTKELINIGNVIETITSVESKINELKTFIDNFQPMVPKTKIVFDKVEPVLNQLSVDNIQSEINEITTKSNEIKTDLESLKTNKLTSFNDLDILITAKLKNIESEKIRLLAVSDVIKEKITNNFKSVIEYIDKIVVSLNNKQKATEEKINNFKQTIIANILKIEENNNSILSGTCEKCHRAFSVDFESHKTQLLEQNEELTRINNEQKTLQDTEKELLQKIVDTLKVLNSSRDLALQQSDVILDEMKLKVGCMEFFTNIHNLRNDEKQNLIDIQNNSVLNNNWHKVVQLKTDINLNISEFVDISLNPSLEFIILKLKNIEDSISLKTKEIFGFDTKITKLNSDITEIKNQYISELQTYQSELNKNIQDNNNIENFNKTVDEHNKQILIKTSELNSFSVELINLRAEKLPVYNALNDELQTIKNSKFIAEQNLKNLNAQLNSANINITKLNNDLLLFEKEYSDYLKYIKNDIVWKIYSKLIKDHFKEIVFEYYRTFLNQTLNKLLSNVNFKLFWNQDSELYMVSYKNGVCSYQPVQQSSGMETTFLGLALVYTMHLLNVKNSISHIFIDEISGTLNKGEDLTYDADNFQELMVLILSKFKDKSVFIVDHNIKNLFETITYEVQPDKFGSKFVVV